MALACVCFFWGTTYLGIRMALESFSPAMLMCLRYAISGGALLIGALVAGARLPTRGEAWRTALYGLLTIGVGTGSLAYSEQWIPSGMASLFASLQPFYLVGAEALAPGGEPRMQTSRPPSLSCRRNACGSISVAPSSRIAS